MSKQAARQRARREVRETANRRRQQQLAQQRRIEGLGVTLVLALEARDEAVRNAEHEAGAALRSLVDDEGLSLTDAVTWTGDRLSLREAARLKKLALSPAHRLEAGNQTDEPLPSTRQTGISRE